jgi:hypothetical protein
MAKRRKPGGGRKPKPDRKVLFTIRLLPHVLAELKSQAQTWQGGSGNVSAFTEALIDKGLRERAEEKRDPALKALLYFVAQIAGWASGYWVIIEEEELEDHIPTFWHTDQLSFRAFKFAVRGLLDLIEEPPENPLAREGREKFRAILGTSILGTSMDMSPERLGETILHTLWLRGTSERYAQRLIESARGTPVAHSTERGIYGMIQAVRDLQFKSKPEGNSND